MSQQSLKIQEFSNFQKLESLQEIEEDKIQSNVELQDQEIESLQSILNEAEFQIIEDTKNLVASELERSKIKKVVRFSLIPNSSKKFLLVDGAKDISVELRCLPALELSVILTEGYPSHIGPLFQMTTPFYQQFKSFLIEKLSEKWQEEMITLYECVYFVQDEFLNQYFENDANGSFKFNQKGQFEIKFNSSSEFQKIFDLSMEAQRRSFNSEEHDCKICMRTLLGDKFFFLSGCEHNFCIDCVKSMVSQAINNGKVNQLMCADASCKTHLNDLDIRNLNLEKSQLEKYEQFSLNNAIAQMDDLGWCPLPGCQSLATLERDQNFGKCQHCDYMFCLDCRERYHPYKRCIVNRLDLYDLLDQSEKDTLEAKNKIAEQALNTIFFKYCAKFCPNIKCGIRIQKEKSGCTQMQCPKCFHYFCWVCLHDAKGQKHYKEKPECKEEQPSLQPDFITSELKQKHLGEGEDYINLKFCAKCPNCHAVNEKKTRANALTCHKCEKMFCYICNKPISGLEHYTGKSLCHYESDPWADF